MVLLIYVLHIVVTPLGSPPLDHLEEPTHSITIWTEHMNHTFHMRFDFYSSPQDAMTENNRLSGSAPMVGPNTTTGEDVVYCLPQTNDLFWVRVGYAPQTNEDLLEWTYGLYALIIGEQLSIHLGGHDFTILVTRAQTGYHVPFSAGYSRMGLGPIFRISSAKSLTSFANRSPSAALTKTIFTLPSSKPNCWISFFAKRTLRSAPKFPVLNAQSPGWHPTIRTPSAPSCRAFRMKLMSSLAVHGIRMILLVTSYCNFIVPARSEAAYIHCIHPNTMMFISFGGIVFQHPRGE